MSQKKKPDSRVPQPLAAENVQKIKNFMVEMSEISNTLLSISVDDIKGFKKMSADDRKYVNDVIDIMNKNNGKVATNVKSENIKKAKESAEQFREIAHLFDYWATIYERNALQADSLSYQHAAVFETDIENAMNMDVAEAAAMKEVLESNRNARNSAAAATRKANAKQDTVVTNN